MTDVNDTYSGDQFAIYTLNNHYVITIIIFYNIIILTYNIILTCNIICQLSLNSTKKKIKNDETVADFQARQNIPLGDVWELKQRSHFILSMELRLTLET